MGDTLHKIRLTSYAFCFSILPMISSSTLTVHVLFCATVVPLGSQAFFQSILKPLRIFSVSDLWRKPHFPGKTIPVWCPSWDPGCESSVSDSGKSQWSGSWLQKSIEYHVESDEAEVESKRIFVIQSLLQRLSVRIRWLISVILVQQQMGSRKR